MSTIENRVKQRKNRQYQQRARDGKRSYLTDIENLSIILAYEAGEITECHAARALGVGIVEARRMRIDALALGTGLARAI